MVVSASGKNGSSGLVDTSSTGTGKTSGAYVGVCAGSMGYICRGRFDHYFILILVLERAATSHKLHKKKSA